MKPEEVSILLVEDERSQRDPLAKFLRRQGYRVHAVASGEEGKERLAGASYDVLITDLRLPGIDGLAVVRHAHSVDEEMGVLLTTAYASVDSAVEALRLGAHDYLLKPLSLAEVGRKVGNLLEHRKLMRENASLRHALQQQIRAHEVVCESAGMKEALNWARRAGKSPRTNVLIVGETGTGKEVMARTVHQMSGCVDEPFLALNVAAIPENMVESELFGHERGAFTGAERRRDGILRAAGKGTVFLDEIGELPLSVQAKLLRTIEMHEVQPLGSDLSVPYEARVVAATHRDLEAMVEARTFREDLYYRLNVIKIHLPPLRERPDDIPILVRHFLTQQARSKEGSLPIVTAAALRALCGHYWRGNVRELKNVLERAVILADDGRIGLEQLPVDVREQGESLGLTEAIERFERGHIAMVLRLCDGNREQAAKALGISSATLYRRLERLQLKSEPPLGSTSQM